jgi:hypothetical protein
MPRSRAFQVAGPKKPLEKVEPEVAEPGPGQVRVRVEACGVCHSDYLTVEGHWPGISYPRVPGHEIAGTIDALGRDVPGWAVGDRVGIGWHGGNCGYCEWDSFPLAPGVTLTAVPARHFSSRSPFDRDRTLWCGWVVTGPSGSFYFAGDTGWGSHFQLIHDRFPNLRLAFLPIGAYRPRWFMSQAHIDPEEAVRAQETLGAETAVAIHFGTFAQADDGESEPIEALKSALARRPDSRPRFLVLDNGQSLELQATAAIGAM